MDGQTDVWFKDMVLLGHEDSKTVPKLNQAASTAGVLTAALNHLTGLGASYQITAYIGSV